MSNQVASGAGARFTPDDLPGPNGETGSFLLVGIVFFLLFLTVASFGIDLSRYFLKVGRLQEIADGAAMAGAGALNQYRDRPDRARVYRRVLDYIEDHQGPEYRDLYEIHSPTDVDGIDVSEGPTSYGPCQPDFSIQNGSLVLDEPADFRTRILGTAIHLGGRTTDPLVPVTLQLQLSTPDGGDTVMEPWGPFDDPVQGDLNTGQAHKPIDLNDNPPGTRIEFTARSWVNGNPHMTVSTTPNDPARTLQDGDPVPGTQGYQDQSDLSQYLQNYVDENGNVELESNQAIVFFELGNQSGTAADYQDLVILLSFRPTGSSSGSMQNGQVTVQTGSDDESFSCRTEAYRVGVVVRGAFKPYFLPRKIFGEDPRTLARIAVAEVRPAEQRKIGQSMMDCGVFADRLIQLGGNNIYASQTNFCTNQSLRASSSNNGTIGDVTHLESGVFTAPGGGYGEVHTIENPRELPRFRHTNPGDYDVRLTNTRFQFDLPACPNGPGRMLVTSDDTQLKWSDSSQAVCVKKTSSAYVIDAQNAGRMRQLDGSPVTIYADDTVSFPRNGTGLYGGLYSQGDVHVFKNNHFFVGSSEKLGGLALWSEGTIQIHQNNVEIRGIIGTEGDLSLGSNGGGTGPVFRGIAIVGRDFIFPSNSNQAKIIHATMLYEREALESGEWIEPVQESLNRPNYANTRTRLIYTGYPPN